MVTDRAGTPLAFRAVADPTRRAILDLLRTGRQPATKIARGFPVSRPAISKHLRILREADLVSERRHGRNRIYELNPEPLRGVEEWVSRYRTFWTRSLQSLKDHVEAKERGE
ncbi:MAG: winged helix-turn-helix transcriptional regulator [bacterium]|nr:winged helix-turn-helix transcriptional regulator [bacterium]